MIQFPPFPYEIIGKATFLVVVLVLSIVIVGAAVFVGFAAWVRGFVFISNLMWRGYEPNGERPPLWKMRISGVTLALSRFKFSKLGAIWNETEELVDGSGADE